MIYVDARGEACPIPVVKTKTAIRKLHGSGQVEVLADQEIAVQNLLKMAEQKGYQAEWKQRKDGDYQVLLTIGESNLTGEASAPQAIDNETENGEQRALAEERGRKKNVVAAIGSRYMGQGSEELGSILMKGFLYALTKQDELPDTLLFYNSGAYLTCKDSEALEDLKELERAGVKIWTCGTCLDYYGLKEELALGEVTNMYAIVEAMGSADVLVKP